MDNKIENQNELPPQTNNDVVNNIIPEVVPQPVEVVQPVVETAPVVEVTPQPVEVVQPVVETAPVVEVTPQPVEVVQPVVETTPVVEVTPQPVEVVQPVVETTPVVDVTPQPVEAVQPVVEATPVVDVTPQPVEAVQPVVETTPVVDVTPQPVEAVQPVVEATPEVDVTPQPVEAVQPVVEATPEVDVTPQPAETSQTATSTDASVQQKTKKSNPLAIIIIILSVIILGVYALQKFGIISKNNDNTETNNSEVNENNNKKEDKPILLEKVSIDGYMCLSEECIYNINGVNESSSYSYNGENKELLAKLNDYEEYIDVNIYYYESSNKKIINSYEIILKENNTNISDVKSEDELREKIGLFALGTHTESLILKKIGNIGAGSNDNESYAYIKYDFESNNGKMFTMKYILSEGQTAEKLQEGNTYEVTFEVVEGTFGLEYNIKETIKNNYYKKDK